MLKTLLPPEISLDPFLGLSGNNIAVAEDLEGNLQFYSAIPESVYGHKNVCLVYDKTGRLMKNSHKIKSDAKAKPIVLKHQGNDNNYYLFTIGTDQRPYYHVVDMSQQGYGTAAGEVVEKNTAMDITSEYKYGYHMALIEDNITKTGLLYMTRYVPSSSPDVPGNTEIVVFEFKEEDTGSPVPQVVTRIPGYDLKGEGELQISPDGKQIAYYNRKKSIAGFAHQEAEINLLTLGEDRKTVVTTTIIPGQEGGTYGKSSVDIANDKDYLYFNQWGVYQYDETKSEKNVFQHNLKATSDQLVLGVQYGEVRRGFDGKMYLAPQNQNDKLYTLGEEDNGNITIGTEPVASSALGYGLSGNLPVQSFRYARANDGFFTRKVGEKQYELKDHLGNVRAVISDLRGATIVGSEINSYAIVESYNDYFPFGSVMPGRGYSSGEYRYGFNGKEKDDEGEWGTTNYDYGFRIYSPGIARFLSVDPLTKKYPMLTPYQFASNRPIDGIDLDGLEFYKSGKVAFSLGSFKNPTIDDIVVNTKEAEDVLHGVKKGSPPPSDDDQYSGPDKVTLKRWTKYWGGAKERNVNINLNGNKDKTQTNSAKLGAIMEAINLIHSFLTITEQQKENTFKVQLIALDKSASLVRMIEDMLPERINNSTFKKDLTNYITDFETLPEINPLNGINDEYINLIQVMGKEIYNLRELIWKKEYKSLGFDYKEFEMDNDLDRSNGIPRLLYIKAPNKVSKAYDAYIKSTNVKLEESHLGKSD